MSRKKRAEEMYPEAHYLWEIWASDRQWALAETGHDNTSPNYRIMREGLSPDANRALILEHRASRSKAGLTLTPKITALGKETKSRRIHDMTGPEQHADKYQKTKTMEMLFRQIPMEWAKLIALRYSERESSRAALARELDMDRKEVDGYLKAALAWTHNMLVQIGYAKAVATAC